MEKRKFLKLTGLAGAGLVAVPLAASIVGCGNGEHADTRANKTDAEPNGGAPKEAVLFRQAALGYATDALAPAIDQETMELHFGKHHRGYVKKLNRAVRKQERFAGMDLGTVLAAVSGDVAEDEVRNNAGGHFNHSMYWRTMEPGGAPAPAGDLAEALSSSFGGSSSFQREFSAAAKGQFGSGWAWLIADEAGRLKVASTPNQDNPLMKGVVDSTVAGTPILGIDVWEHAYYLQYQNRRGDYIAAFMEQVNWDAVGANFQAALG